MTDLPAFIALSLLPSGWYRAIHERLRAGEGAGTVFDDLTALRCSDEPGKAAALRAQASAAIAAGATSGLAPIAWCDPAYPAPLAAIADPPLVLWTRGDRAALERPAVAIVGSRAGSPYALAVAGQLAADLAARGLAVVSGLARGVDSAAHRGALDGGGATIAVLGSGADVIYPPENAPLVAAIEPRGLVLSELVPGTAPQPMFFPRRNRIISGLSRAVVVIEAGEKSGSLITARCALEQGREVLAVPGNVLSGRNRGAHALLKDGAKIVETADDILEEIRGTVPPAGASASGPEGPPPQPDAVLACLTRGEPADLDEISEQTGLSAARLLPRLFELELQGRVTRVGGGRFVRI